MDFMKWVRYQWDRAAALGAFLLGIICLIIGYIGVSGSVYPAEQLPYIITGGVLGIFFLGTAGILYLSADLRDEWRKLDSLGDLMEKLVANSEAEQPAAHVETLRAVRQ